MFVIRNQIKNKIIEVIIFITQQLIIFIVVFTKITKLINTSFLLNTKNDDIFFDFFTSFSFVDDVFFISFVKQLRAENVKYFDFDYKQKKKFNIISKAYYILVVNAKKYIYYIEIFVFVDKLKNLIKQHNEVFVNNVVIFCFRDSALM